MTDLAAVYRALSEVRDPEVDRPITAMGFVDAVEQRADGVHVTLRLPTYFCAPNFAYLMMADAQRAVDAVVGPGRARVALHGHFESGRLSDAMAADRSFSQTFGEEAAGELDELRDRFRRKTFLVRQERLCRRLEAAGVEDLLGLTIGALPSTADTSDYLTLRRDLGIDCTPSSPLLVAADGTPVRPERLHLHRRSATVLGASFDSNGALCQSLLASRYAQPGPVREGANA